MLRKCQLPANRINPILASYPLNPIEESEHDAAIPDVEGAHIVREGQLGCRQAKQLASDLVPRDVPRKLLSNCPFPSVQTQLTVSNECIDRDRSHKLHIRVD